MERERERPDKTKNSNKIRVEINGNKWSRERREPQSHHSSWIDCLKVVVEHCVGIGG
jgi:hypothetical protein